MSRRRAVWLVSVAVVGGLLASCADTPSPATVPTAVPTSPRYGAPEVAFPRDASEAVVDPCALLLDRQVLRRLGFLEPGRARTLVDVPECVWTNDRDERLSIAVDTRRDLLADTYRTRLLPIFVPTTVEGMPAVRQRMRADDNTCTVTTGLGPRQALETEWSGLSTRQTTDPCAKAEEAIALVVRKLPPQR